MQTVKRSSVRKARPAVCREKKVDGRLKATGRAEGGIEHANCSIAGNWIYECYLFPSSGSVHVFTKGYPANRRGDGGAKTARKTWGYQGHGRTKTEGD